MTCFDYLVVAKKYADEILKEYKTLIRLDSSDSRGKLYERHLEKLKEIVEFEDFFYSELAKCEVDFMEEKVLKKPFVLEDVSILDFSFQELEETGETLAWNRVGQKLSRERIRKTYPDYHFSLEQIGMIPLTPSDMDNFSLDYLNKEATLTGCFNMAFSQHICFDSIYSSFMKTLECWGADLDYPSVLLSLSILKDGLYVFSQIAPISVSNMLHSFLLQWEGNPFVKSYLDKAVMASLTKRKENDKQKRLSKNR